LTTFNDYSIISKGNTNRIKHYLVISHNKLYQGIKKCLLGKFWSGHLKLGLLRLLMICLNHRQCFFCIDLDLHVIASHNPWIKMAFKKMLSKNACTGHQTEINKFVRRIHCLDLPRYMQLLVSCKEKKIQNSQAKYTALLSVLFFIESPDIGSTLLATCRLHNYATGTRTRTYRQQIRT
jgi:hypothetical protein